MVAASLVTIPTLAAAQKHDGSDHIAAVSVPEGPALVKDIDLAVLPAASAGLLHGNAGERRRVSAAAGEERPQADEGSSAKADGSGAIRSEWFTIQVAESINARHARAMVDELKNAGHVAYLERAASSVNAPYRVRVGHFSTVADATRSARTLEKALGWQMSVTAISAESVVQGTTVGYVK
jgi:cell division septation protein DedD